MRVVMLGAMTWRHRIGEDKAWEISSGPVERLPKPVPVEADPTFAVLAKALA